MVKEVLSRSEFQFWIPICIIIVSICASYFSLSNRQAVIGTLYLVTLIMALNITMTYQEWQLHLLF
jgi:hypothetical protein